jgi:hypothetical protein
MPTIDPNRWFIGTQKQTRRYRAFVQITVDGVPVTDRLDPFLISVHVFDGAPFTAEIELDDRDGRLPIPPLAAPLHIEMGWAAENMSKVFTGYIKEVEHGFGRQAGGRRMWVHGISYNAAGVAKQPEQMSEGERTAGATRRHAHSVCQFHGQGCRRRRDECRNRRQSARHRKGPLCPGQRVPDESG